MGGMSAGAGPGADFECTFRGGAAGGEGFARAIVSAFCAWSSLKLSSGRRVIFGTAWFFPFTGAVGDRGGFEGPGDLFAGAASATGWGRFLATGGADSTARVADMIFEMVPIAVAAGLCLRCARGAGRGGDACGRTNILFFGFGNAFGATLMFTREAAVLTGTGRRGGSGGRLTATAGRTGGADDIRKESCFISARNALSACSASNALEALMVFSGSAFARSRATVSSASA